MYFVPKKGEKELLLFCCENAFVILKKKIHSLVFGKKPGPHDGTRFFFKLVVKKRTLSLFSLSDPCTQLVC